MIAELSLRIGRGFFTKVASVSSECVVMLKKQNCTVARFFPKIPDDALISLGLELNGFQLLLADSILYFIHIKILQKHLWYPSLPTLHVKTSVI